MVAIAAFITLGAILLRLLNMLRPFSVPTGAMTPAVSVGDHIMVEGFTYLFHKPHRGDVVVFRTDGIDSLPPQTFYIKRLVGLPGERLRISDGKLYVNDAHVPLKNATGEISYVFLPVRTQYLTSSNDTVTVPDGCYFVLGDNSSNSADSRFWGFVPAKNIIGRGSVCYWPPGRMGSVK